MIARPAPSPIAILPPGEVGVITLAFKVPLMVVGQLTLPIPMAVVDPPVPIANGAPPDELIVLTYKSPLIDVLVKALPIAIDVPDGGGEIAGVLKILLTFIVLAFNSPLINVGVLPAPIRT